MADNEENRADVDNDVHHEERLLTDVAAKALRSVQKARSSSVFNEHHNAQYPTVFSHSSDPGGGKRAPERF